jgi:hypothetical protein
MPRIVQSLALLTAVFCIAVPRASAQQGPCRKLNKFADHVRHTSGVDTTRKRAAGREEPRGDVRTVANGCKRGNESRDHKAEVPKQNAETLLTRALLPVRASWARADVPRGSPPGSLV